MKAWLNSHAAMLHALATGTAGALLMSLSAGLASLAHIPTLKGVLMGGLIAAASRLLGMLGNMLEPPA